MGENTNKEPPLRLLVVDENPSGADGVVAALHDAGLELQWQRLADAASLRAALSAQTWDVAVCQHRVPGMSALAAYRLTLAHGLDLPFIVIAANAADKHAARALRAGAHACFRRGRLEHLAETVRREVAHARDRADHRAALEMLKDSEARFRALASNLPGMVFHLQYEPGQELRFLYVSDGCHRLLALKQHELLRSSAPFLAAIDGADRAALQLAITQSAASLGTLNWEGRIRCKGQEKWINLRSTPARRDAAQVQWQGIATDITRSKVTEAALRRSRQQLSELSHHLEVAKEEERERIARDIHDELGSTLVALKIETSLLAGKLPPPGMAASEDLQQKAHAIEALINGAISTAGRVARELRPGILKEFGLTAAIECQADDFHQRTGISCRVDCDDGGKEPDKRTSLALFRVLQEALTNVAKHARASLVAVRLRRDDNFIVLEVRDNGRGISEADLNKPRSFGLRGMRERIGSLNGEFIIGQGETGGSHLTLRVPDGQGGDAPPTIQEILQRSLF